MNPFRSIALYNLALIFITGQCNYLPAGIYNDEEVNNNLNTPIHLLTPEHGDLVDKEHILFTWNNIPDADGYRVIVSEFETLNSPVVDNDVADSSFTTASLDPGSNYYWQVESLPIEGRVKKSDIRTFQTKSLPADTQREIRILPAGDSITEAIGYRLSLLHMLTEYGYEFSFVGSGYEPVQDTQPLYHEGHGGWRISHISNNINSWIDQHSPTHILLMIGTNDIAWWTPRDAIDIAMEHAELVDQILAAAESDLWLFVATIPPQSSLLIGPNYIDRALLTQDFNRELQNQMQLRINGGANLVLVDVYSELTTENLPDGIHPDSEGYEIIARKWADSLLPILRDPG